MSDIKDGNGVGAKGQSNKKNNFAHLGRASQVIANTSKRGLLSAFIGIVVIVVIFTISLSGGHKKAAVEQQTQSQTNNNLILQENAERLAELQREKGEVRYEKEQSENNSKEMNARRNAPTQMYSAANPGKNNEEGGSAKSSTLTGHGTFASFANSQSASASTVSATKIKHPYYTIAEGEFVHANLETAIDSDMPGMVRAVISRPVYAYLGEAPLIPAGSRLIGQYASSPSNGSASTRVFVMWNRIITPKGISIMINSPGTDSLGRAGQGADVIDDHFFKIFGTAALLSIMGVTAATSGVGAYDQPNSANQYRQAVSGAFQQSAQTILQQNMSVKPTLHVYQGAAINVFVAHDLDLYSVLANQ